MSGHVIAVRMDDARDFIVDPIALTVAPSVSTEFPIGCRVRVTDVGKCFPKSDTMASALLLGKWATGLKPHEGTVGTVLASSKHPADDSCTVVGIRSELDNRDFVMDIRGIARAPNLSEDFPEGSTVRVTSAEKVYSKMDAAAKELTLSKWAADTKPQDDEVATVLGSTKKPGEDEEALVIGIRTAKGQDFVIAPDGLEKFTPSAGKFDIGSRVYISNIEKLFPKMDDIAKQIGLSRWVSGAKPTVPQVPAAENNDESAAKKRKINKPLMSCTGEVKGSVQHPNGEALVIGVRTETGQEFLVAEDGLDAVPHEHPDFPCGTRVKITDVGKVYPKWDEKAFKMALPRWVYGEKPEKVFTGKVVGSVAK